MSALAPERTETDVAVIESTRPKPPKKSNGCQEYTIIRNGDVVSHHLDEKFMGEWLVFKDKFQEDYIKYKSGDRSLNGELTDHKNGKTLSHDQAQEFIDEIFKIYVE